MELLVPAVALAHCQGWGAMAHIVAAQVGVDMGRFREFPYRGSLLRKMDGQVQEVFHEPVSAKARSRARRVRSAGLGQQTAQARLCGAPVNVRPRLHASPSAGADKGPGVPHSGAPEAEQRLPALGWGPCAGR
jgi:hypothetical protein